MIEKINEQIINGFIDLEFNEYLWLHGATDIIYLNDDKAHYHFDDKEKLKQWLLDIAEGKIIFLEDKNSVSLKRLLPVRPWDIKTITQEEFERNKEKYLSKKCLRIYTGNEIIKKV